MYHIFLFVLTSHVAWSSPRVTKSQFNSHGRITPSMSAIENIRGLHSTLANCSYQNELVIISSSTSFADAAAQTIHMLHRYGIHHIIVVAPGPTSDGCQQLRPLLAYPPAGVCCMWSEAELPPQDNNDVARNAFSPQRTLMHSRLRLAALALRLSYNLLFLDTYVILYDEPYRALKAFSPINLLAPGSTREVNLGVMYVQNVSSDGPVAWIFAEAVDRILRWAENETWVREGIGSSRGFTIHNYQHMSWDQMSFGDVLMSTATARRPMFFSSWMFQEPRTSGQEALPFDKMVAGWRDSYHNWTSQGIPKELLINDPPDFIKRMATLELGIDRSAEISTVELGRVFTKGLWPQGLGGHAFPPQRGDYSRAWQDLLAKVSSHPLWPDPDDPSCYPSESQGIPVRCQWRGNELAGFLPSWLQSQYTSRLAGQQYSCSAESEPTQVFGHLLYLSNEKKIYKNALKQIFGCYSWTVANRSKNGSIYYASTPSIKIPHVLAPSEALVSQMEKMSTIGVLSAHRQLYLMARSINRAFAWPALSCKFLNSLHSDIVSKKELARNKDRYWPMNHAYTIPWRNGSCVWVDESESCMS